MNGKKTLGQQMAAFDREADERDWRFEFRDVLQQKQKFPSGTIEYAQFLTKLLALLNQALEEGYEIPATQDPDVSELLHYLC